MQQTSKSIAAQTADEIRPYVRPLGYDASEAFNAMSDGPEFVLVSPNLKAFKAAGKSYSERAKAFTEKTKTVRELLEAYLVSFRQSGTSFYVTPHP